MPKRQLFHGIKHAYTLEGAARKGARHVVQEDLSVIDKAAIVESGGLIEWIGPEKKLPKHYLKKGEISRDVDLGGATILPALVECHTHLIYSGSRAEEFEKRNQGVSYQAIAQAGGGILSTVRATRKASEAELLSLAQERVERFLRQGVATIEIKSGYGLSTKEELKLLRVANKLGRARIVPTVLGAHAVPPEFKTDLDYVEHLLSDLLPKVKKENLSSRVDIFMESGYFGRQATKRYLEGARELGFHATVHADQLTRSGGARMAIEAGAQSADHLLQIDASDVKALAASEVTCVFLPSSDLYMNCSYPPARALIDQGARVALATDFNPGSSPSADVSLVGVLARIYMRMTLTEAIAAYTIGAAHVIGSAQKLGSLERGKVCDFAVLSSEFPDVFLDIGRFPLAILYREGRKTISN